MLLRVAVVCACVLGAASAIAEELGPDQARAFVVGKLFAYTCFDGTAGMGRIFADGSVVGTIRPGGRGEARRNACAMLFSWRCGLSAQTLAKALAVERLMPA